jgi:NIMA-interacting peptidyl-prolyl cis-trans isomerase 1
MLDTKRRVKANLDGRRFPALAPRTDQVRERTAMSKLVRLGALLSWWVVVVGCDGTLTGIGRVPREPETKLSPAPVETAKGSKADPAGAPAPDEPSEIAAQHLLVMYKGSKAAPASVTRTREDARVRAGEALTHVKAGEAFDKVVAAYTDEPGGAKRGGELGRFGRDMMVKPFADAAFALEVGQVSGVVESPFGFHVIKRTE